MTTMSVQSEQEKLVESKKMTRRPLVVIDIQHAFIDPNSAWQCGDAEAALDQIKRLLPHFDRVIYTRFVPQERPTGAWKRFWAELPQWHLPDSDHAWHLVVTTRPQDSVITTHRYVEWNDELRAALGDAEDFVLVGMSTSCCVLATMFDALDDGVLHARDGCVGWRYEGATHRYAGDGARPASMVKLMTTDEVLEELRVGS